MGEIVGGVALVGVALLIGLAIADDDAPETLTATDPTLGETAAPATDPAASPAATPSSSATSTVPATSSEASTEESSDETTTPDSTVETTEASTTSTSATTSTATSTTLSAAQRAEISVKVLNAGAASGEATDVTAAVRFAGFTADGPADASAQVGATTVLYAPGQQAAAAAVNTLISASPSNVIEGTADNPNWARYGTGVDVLVALGPGQG